MEENDTEGEAQMIELEQHKTWRVMLIADWPYAPSGAERIRLSIFFFTFYCHESSLFSIVIAISITQ